MTIIRLHKRKKDLPSNRARNEQEGDKAKNPLLITLQRVEFKCTERRTQKAEVEEQLQDNV